MLSRQVWLPIAAALTCVGVGTNALAAQVTVDASVGPRFGGGGMAQSFSATSGPLTAGAAAGNVMLPALRDVPGSISGRGDLAAGLSSSARARNDAGNSGLSVSASAVGLLAVADTAANYLASATASSSFQDTIEVKGESGASSSTMRLDAEAFFSMKEDVFALYPGSAGTGSSAFYASVSWTWQDPSGRWQEYTWLVCTWSNSCARQTSDFAAPGLHAYEREITARVGSAIYQNTTMWASAEAYIYNATAHTVGGGGTASATVDGWNSLRTGITVLTPGTSIRADSGHDYVFRPHAVDAPPVPLPAAAWLLLSGLAGVGVLGRRGKQGAPAAT